MNNECEVSLYYFYNKLERFSEEEKIEIINRFAADNDAVGLFAHLKGILTDEEFVSFLDDGINADIYDDILGYNTESDDIEYTNDDICFNWFNDRTDISDNVKFSLSNRYFGQEVQKVMLTMKRILSREEYMMFINDGYNWEIAQWCNEKFGTHL